MYHEQFSPEQTTALYKAGLITLVEARQSLGVYTTSEDINAIAAQEGFLVYSAGDVAQGLMHPDIVSMMQERSDDECPTPQACDEAGQCLEEAYANALAQRRQPPGRGRTQQRAAVQPVVGFRTQRGYGC